MRYMHAGIVAVAMLSTSTVGCYRHHTNEAPIAAAMPAGEKVRVTVDNNSFSDFDLFVEADGGARSRLATVQAGTESEYKVTASPSTGTIQLVATPVGRHGITRTGPLPVVGGSAVTFTIEPNLRMSYSTVRYGAR